MNRPVTYIDLAFYSFLIMFATTEQVVYGIVATSLILLDTYSIWRKRND